MTLLPAARCPLRLSQLASALCRAFESATVVPSLPFPSTKILFLSTRHTSDLFPTTHPITPRFPPPTPLSLTHSRCYELVAIQAPVDVER